MHFYPDSLGARLLEHNDCHSKQDGKFCSGGGKAPSINSFAVRPGEKVDFNALRYRRFLSHPDGTLILGQERDDPEDRLSHDDFEGSHAELLHTVLMRGAPGVPKRYDDYTLRGYILKGTVKVETWNEGVIRLDDDISKLVERLLISGAPTTTRIEVPGWGPYGGETLKQGWPDLVKRYRKRAA